MIFEGNHFLPGNKKEIQILQTGKAILQFSVNTDIRNASYASYDSCRDIPVSAITNLIPFL